MLYAASTGGFYASEIHGNNIPADAVEVTDSEYAALFTGQAEGKVIAPDNAGRPVLQDRPPPTAEQVRAAKVAMVQSHMEESARALGYDSIGNAITYADEPAVPRFQAEAQAFRAWRSLVWARCYEILDEVQAGKRDIPGDEELISELPELNIRAT